MRTVEYEKPLSDDPEIAAHLRGQTQSVGDEKLRIAALDFAVKSVDGNIMLNVSESIIRRAEVFYDFLRNQNATGSEAGVIAPGTD